MSEASKAKSEDSLKLIIPPLPLILLKILGFIGVSNYWKVIKID